MIVNMKIKMTKKNYKNGQNSKSLIISMFSRISQL